MMGSANQYICENERTRDVGLLSSGDDVVSCEVLAAGVCNSV